MPGLDLRKVDAVRRPLEKTSPARRRRIAAVGLGGAALLLSACSPRVERGYLPHGVTKNANEVIDFWLGTWYWTLAVGVLVWGLIFWCIVRYRRRKSDTGFPAQMQYNVPLEILYTVVPIVMVAVLFGKTVGLENKLLDTSPKPDVTINVVGKQWSWDFNYADEKVYETGVMADMKAGKPGAEKGLPTLYLPVNKRVEFVLTTRDVIHTFWVPQFMQKLDMIPSRVNRFAVDTTEEGTFKGKCAELCGAYHSQMLFNVKVVSQEEYDKHMDDLRKQGKTGFLSNSLNRASVNPKDQQFLPDGLDSSDIVKEGK